MSNAAHQQDIPSLEQAIGSEPVFESLHDGYRMMFPKEGATFEIAFLRREGGQLKGELMTRTANPSQDRNGSGVLSITDINLSASRTRKSHGTYLAERAKTSPSVDWVGMLEDFSQSVLLAEREGEPARLLSDFPDPEPVETWSVHGFPLLQRHPSIIFGDGSSAKSYLSLWFAGELSSQQGRRVLYCDWELNGQDHKARLTMLYPGGIPPVAYIRCRRPLFYESERIRRICREHQVDFLVLDSISFAVDGNLNDGDVAGRYFQALREIGEIGSLSCAHISKNGEHSDKRPFGSAMWFNGARGVWNIKRAESEPGAHAVHVALHDRKHNLGGHRASIGFRLAFLDHRTHVARVSLDQVPELAVELPVRERVLLALRHGPVRRSVLSVELADVPAESLSAVLQQLETAQRILVQEGGHGSGSDTISLLDTTHSDGG